MIFGSGTKVGETCPLTLRCFGKQMVLIGGFLEAIFVTFGSGTKSGRNASPYSQVLQKTNGFNGGFLEAIFVNRCNSK